MWEMYDALINGIPEELKTDELVCGYPHTYVRSGEGSGIAGIRLFETRMPMFTKDLIGMPLREVASCIKSWNFIEASVGLAAINAYYNNPKVAKENGVEFSEAMRVEDRKFDPFIMSQNEVRGKKVAVIGHFPYLQRLMEPICDLAIIETDPGEGDYPFSASEYLLTECDYVFMTSSCLIDKTLPRLLELSGNAKRVTLVSPGTPLAPQLFDFGIDVLSGFIIKDNLRAFRIVAGAERVKIYATGQKVAFKNKCNLT